MAEEPAVEPAVESSPPPEPQTDPQPAPAPSEPKTNGSDPTLALDGGGDDPAQPVPATWPEDWKQRFAGNNPDDLKVLNRYKEPANIWKSYKALRAKMDSGEYKRVRPDTDDEEALTAWREEVGVPQKPEDYYDSLPEGLEISEDDRPFLDDYFAYMHKGDVSAKDAHQGVAAYYEMLQRATEQRLEMDRERRNISEDELRAEWGPEYRPNLNGLHSLFDLHAPEGLKERLFSARFDDGSLLGDDPEVLKFLVGLSGEINPHGVVTPVAGQDQMKSIADRLAELRVEMADTKGRGKPGSYWESKEKQAEYQQLLALEERMQKRQR